jgi:Zn-dependent protease
MWTQGLILAFITALMGFVFAAPGAVYISGMITKRQNGIISAAGPGVNIAIAFVMMALALFSTPFIAGVALFIAWINIFLAGFNLIPLPPLDGSKILAWGVIPYLSMVVAVAVAYLSFIQF